MELDHEFTVPVPVDQAWSVLLDVERVALCMPGATLDTIDGEEYAGRLKVKLGAMTITYRGTARIVSADEATHTVTIEGSGKEARGSGTAAATIQAQLRGEGDTTRATVHTKLNVTGRPAQFGRNILSEVGGKLISRFAKNLSDELLADSTPAAAPAAAPAAEDVVNAEADTPPNGIPVVSPDEAVEAKSSVPQPSVPQPSVPQPRAASPAESAPRLVPVARDEDAINLLEFAGPSVAKRAAPAVGAIAALLTVRYLFRRRRGRHHR